MPRHHEVSERNGKFECSCGYEAKTLAGAEAHLKEGQGSVYHQRHSDPKWEELRELAKAKSGNRCSMCGLSDDEHKNRDDLFGGGLHVHHIVPVREFDCAKSAHAIENLEAVCANCHDIKEVYYEIIS